jgi:hypothetical protein
MAFLVRYTEKLSVVLVVSVIEVCVVVSEEDEGKMLFLNFGSGSTD